MRVLFVSALPPERSSMRGRILPLARTVQNAGHDVEVLTLSGGEASGDDPVSIRTVGPNVRATSARMQNLQTTMSRYWSGRVALSNALFAASADVVVLAKPQFQNTAPALAFAERAEVPLLLDADDLEASSSRLPAPLRWYARRLEVKAAKGATVITACSPYLVDYFRFLHPRARVELLPTGIHIPATVPPARLRERLGLAPDARVILYVGSLSLSSGHRVDTLLDAFTNLEPRQGFANVHLVLSGDGLDEHRLRAHASKSPAKQRIHFLGRFTPPEDIALALDANLLVDPVDQTPTNEAKSSHRTLLALATGTPIVAGRVGIRPLLLPPGLHEDFLYDPDSSNALEKTLAHGLDPDIRARFQAQTQGRIERWTWKDIGSRFVALLESLAPRARRTSGGPARTDAP